MAAGAGDQRRRERRGGVEQLAQQIALQLPLDLLLRALLDQLEREHGGGVLERLRLQRRELVETAHDDATEILDGNADGAVRPVGCRAATRSSARETAARCPARARPRRRAAARARRRCARGRAPVSAASVSVAVDRERALEQRGSARRAPRRGGRSRSRSRPARRARETSATSIGWNSTRPPAADVERADDLLAREHRAAEHRADALAEDRVADPGRGRRAVAGVVGHRHGRAGWPRPRRRRRRRARAACA